MKKTNIIAFVCMLIVLCGCQEQSNLPPNPPAPGEVITKDLVGFATGDATLYNYYGDLGTAFQLDTELFYLYPGSTTFSVSANVDVTNALIYKTGYIYKNGQWEAFDYSGELWDVPGNTKWYLALASKSFTDLQFSDFAGVDDGYIVTYLCTWNGADWDCPDPGVRKWSIEWFEIQQGTLPTDPTVPTALPASIEFDSDVATTTLTPSGFDVYPGDTTFTIGIDVSNANALIWNKAYIYKGSAWVEVPLTGTRYPDASSQWLLSSATATLADQLYSSYIEGNNYIVTYSCIRANDVWNCGCVSSDPAFCNNKWVKESFAISYGVPEDPDAVGSG